MRNPCLGSDTMGSGIVSPPACSPAARHKGGGGVGRSQVYLEAETGPGMRLH